MPDKEPQFTVTDRRKFTLEGDLRDGENAAPDSAGTAPVEAHASPPAPQTPVAGQHPAQTPAAQQTPAAPAQTSQAPPPTPKAEETLPPQPLSAKDEAAAQQHYHATTSQIDDFLRQSNPGETAEAMNFGRLVQSLYVTAMIQLGAGGDPNEEARVDLLGARDSVDMMGVLAEKTKGNLTEDEQHMLQNALFELRMSFLETTNAIASAAQKQPGKAR